MRFLLEIAVTHVLGRARQTAVSILGVALGVGFAIAMAALMQGSQEDFVDTLIDAMPHVRIEDSPRNAAAQPAGEVFDSVSYSGLRPKDDPRGILNPTAAMASLRAWAPGKLAAGLDVSAVARYGGAESGVVAKGVDPVDEAAVSSVDEDVKQGSFLALAGRANGVVIGRSLADQLGASFGDSITLTASGGLARRFEIVAVYSSGVALTDDSTVYILLKSAQILAGRPNAVNEIRIRLDDSDDAQAVADRAEAMLGLKAVSWQEQNEALLENFEVRNVIMYTVVGAILLVAGFGIFNIISIITHEKSRDIAILKSLGFTASDVRQIFVAEGLAIGVIGSLIGWLVGYGLTRLLGQFTINLPGGEEPIFLPVTVDPRHYLIASAFALLSAGVAGYLPARKASSVNPVDIIRGAT